MGNLPLNVAVFFGRIDKRASGWYWIARPTADRPVKGSIAGPFETKPEAVEDAVCSMQQSAARTEEGNSAIERRKETV